MTLFLLVKWINNCYIIILSAVVMTKVTVVYFKFPFKKITCINEQHKHFSNSIFVVCVCVYFIFPITFLGTSFSFVCDLATLCHSMGRRLFPFNKWTARSCPFPVVLTHTAAVRQTMCEDGREGLRKVLFPPKGKATVTKQHMA